MAKSRDSVAWSSSFAETSWTWSVALNLFLCVSLARFLRFLQLSMQYNGGVMVSVSGSRSRGPGFDSRPVHRHATTLGKLLTPMCLLCHQAVQFGTGQRAVMLCGREGNRIRPASHWPCSTDFSGLSTYGLAAMEREMSTPPTIHTGAWSTF